MCKLNILYRLILLLWSPTWQSLDCISIGKLPELVGGVPGEVCAGNQLIPPQQNNFVVLPRALKQK